MAKKFFISLFIFFSIALIFKSANAQIDSSNIKFPIAELGNCGSNDECKTYCDDPAHSAACIDFGEKNGMVSKKEAEVARKVGVKGGPGGCRTKDACETYCSKDSNFDECIKFAEENNMMSAEELANAKKMGNKPGPGGCRGQQCKDYCEKPENREVCLKFAEDNGMISKEEADRARKLGSKEGPGGCKGEECKTYCDNPDHREECFKFAEENGLIPPEELARIKKFRDLTGPGGCKGGECKTYCDNPDHQEECFKFAKENNLIPQEELNKMEKMRETGQNLQSSGGPGGCKSGEECRSYCDDPAHTQECIDFAQKSGMMKPEEAQRSMQEFKMKAGEMVSPLPSNERMNPPSGKEMPSTGNMPPGEERFRQMLPPNTEGDRQQEERVRQLPEGVRQSEGSEGGRPPAGFQPPRGEFPMPPVGQNFPSSVMPPAGNLPVAPLIVPPAPPSNSPTEPAPAPSTQPSGNLLKYSPFGAILNFFLGR